MEVELEAILSWWTQVAIDESHGGFYGKVDHDNKIYPEAAKGAVLNSRILWAFSSAYSLTRNKKYLQIAERSYAYVSDHFIDKEFGGVYWTVDFSGNPLETKKQIYALAFAIYGLSEYCRASGNEQAKQKAIELYNIILRYSYDERNGGYIEALTRNWRQTGDLRLSDKDANEKKSMNTHLHLLEAFLNLYKTWKDESLKQKLTELIDIFLNHIIDSNTRHLVLFFDEEWNARSTIISYGHDIEASWLIREAAELVEDEFLLNKVKIKSIHLVEAASEGVDEDGGVWYEYNPDTSHLLKQKHSWPQAEAMIGFFNAWQITREDDYFRKSLDSWEFVKNYIKDKSLGEWYWGVNADHSPMLQEEKAGIWKCPYHNSRACIEIIHRIENTLNESK